jgi:hypothetical protein
MASPWVVGLSRALLAGTGLIYIILGVAFAIWPTQWAAKLGLVLEHPDSVIEIRAFYGGLELGLGAFFALCAWRKDWLQPGLWGLVFTYGGLASMRGLGLLTEGVGAALQPQMLGIEAFGTALACAALFAARADTPAAQTLSASSSSKYGA